MRDINLGFVNKCEHKSKGSSSKNPNLYQCMSMSYTCFTFHTIIHQHWWHFRYLQDVGYHTNTPEERQGEREKGEILNVKQLISSKNILTTVHHIKQKFT